MKDAWLTAMVCAALAAPAWARGTVSLELTSPQHGTVVPLGAAVDWSIWVSVSPGDNLGLAALGVDLVQDAANNPATFDIPPGIESSIMPPMDQFSRPAGITNPPEGGATTGYIGVQRGTPGAMDLIQIGGAQNTLGSAPSGGAMGQDYFVDGGIGQSGQVLVLSGQMTLPNDPLFVGTYSFSLANGFANTLDEVNTPPSASPVGAALVDLSAGSISITLVPEPGSAALGAVLLMIASRTRRDARVYQPGAHM